MSPRNAIFFGVAAILAAILAVLFQDFIMEYVVVPIAQLFIVIRYYVSSIPQFLVWILLMVIVAVSILRSFQGLREMLKPGSRSVMRKKMGPVESWVDWVYRARGGKYFQGKLQNRVTELGVGILAFRKQLSEDEVVAQIESGAVELPEDTTSFLQTGLEKNPWGSFHHQAFGGFSWVSGSRSESEEERALKNTVKIMKQELRG